jgi:hypothetical protein
MRLGDAAAVRRVADMRKKFAAPPRRLSVEADFGRHVPAELVL